MKVTVKRWFADSKRDEMKKFHLAPCFEYVNEYYADVENGTVTMYVTEVVKETEKAVQVKLECETVNFNGHEPYTTWIPKSQIINLS